MVIKIKVKLKVKVLRITNVPRYPLLKEIQLFCPFCGDKLYSNNRFYGDEHKYLQNVFACYSCYTYFENPCASNYKVFYRYAMDRINEIMHFNEILQKLQNPVYVYQWDLVNERVHIDTSIPADYFSESSQPIQIKKENSQFPFLL